MFIYELAGVLEKILNHLAHATHIYIFFVGCGIIALQCAAKHSWVRSFGFWTLGFFWDNVNKSYLEIHKEVSALISFREVNSFDNREALFWLETLSSAMSFEFNLKALLLYTSLAIFTFIAVKIIFRVLKIDPNKKIINYLGCGLIVVALTQNIFGTIKLYISNSDSYNSTLQNFRAEVPSVTADPKLNVFLYLGESTTVLNMGLYGYPRDTTPRLSELEESESFLKFKNVFSTHTHTSPSLLEALSIPVHSGDDYLPIHQRKRVLVIDVLASANIPTEVFSNQGASGSWNHAGSIVFASANRKFSVDSVLSGNNDYKLKKPWDHVFLNKEINRQKLLTAAPSLFVFHSQAGHGKYLANIPEDFYPRVDDYFSSMNPYAITGKVKSLGVVEEYDSAVRYIDFAVSNAINLINESSAPWVFIYLSDHGEAVFPNSGHDSSRFIHEMVRVPLIMFFNDAAIKSEPNMFRKYSGLSEMPSSSTLSQLPSTIFDLFNLRVEAYAPYAFGEQLEHRPIVVRETNEGVTAVNLNPGQLTGAVVDRTDAATSHFVSSRMFQEGIPSICYHRSNTVSQSPAGGLGDKLLGD